VVVNINENEEEERMKLRRIGFFAVLLLVGFTQADTLVSLNWYKTEANGVEKIDGVETFGIASLGTVTNGWLNVAVGATNDIQGSTVDLSTSFSAGIGAYGTAYNDTALRAGPARYPGTTSNTRFTLSGLNGTFSEYKIIVYLSGFSGNTEAAVDDGSTTYYFQTANPASATLVQTTDTNSGDGYDVANYAVFDGLTADSITIALTGVVGGGASIGGFQVVATTNVPPAAPSTYYLDATNGLDTNSGTASNEAWQTLARASTDNPQAYIPGDEILLKRGETFSGKLYLSEIGSANNPIVVGAYGAGADPVVDAAGYLAGIHLEDCQYVDVRDLEITGDGGVTVDGSDPELRYGVYANVTWGQNADSITLTNLYIHHIFPEVASSNEGANATSFIGNAISFIGNGDYRLSNLMVDNCVIDTTGNRAIEFKRCDGIEVLNNQMTDIGGPAIQPSRCTDMVVRGNIVDGSGSYVDTRMHGRGSGIWPWSSSDVLIENNTFMHARGRADSCGVHIDFGCNDVIVQNNLSIDNAGGFIEILGTNYNCTYRYNISINDGARVKGVIGQGTIPNNQDGHIMWISGHAGSGVNKDTFNTYIYNNTIYVTNTITSTFSIQEWAQGLLIANNIFYVEGATINTTGDYADDYTQEMLDRAVWTNNLYQRVGIIPPGFPFEEVMQTVGDPMFANTGGTNAVDYIPDSGTYVADKGIVVTNLPGDPIGIVGGLTMTEDYFGNPIVGLPDMGAIEMMVPLEQAGMLAGWNFFSPNDGVVNSYVDDSSPDVVLPGVVALLGGEVNPAFPATGGGSRAGAGYDQGGITFGGLVGTGSPTADDSGVLLMHDYDGTAERNRLDFKVTNNTGDDVAVNGIHFDIKTNYKGGASVTNYGTVKVIHFTPVSDLNDTFSLRNLGESNLFNFAWQQLDVSTESMTDVTLADGESASFRIEIDWADSAAEGDPTWYVDNVGISGSIVTSSEPTYAAWSNSYSLVEGELGDDDNDGLINLYEYGLGGDPTNGFVDGNIPAFETAGGDMVYVYAQRNDDTNLVYYLETDTDLVNAPGWTNSGYAVTGTNTTLGGDFDEVTNSIPTTDDQKFIQLVIEKN
jgi:hypothetical protein